ncbi:serine beta-lactamase-like superfamily protein [Thozetella sp. PMI_491]|nr:serine beta-lactamase-like superfamily protein [Thozetella sp. PMI_491]
MSETEDKKSPLDSSKLDELVASALEELNAPGAALAVIDGDQVWAKGYGVSNIETGDKVTPKTMFLAGSTAKSFTAAVTSLLVDEDPAVDWNTPVHKLIPDDFVLEDDYATTHITIADCLSHRSGFSGHRTDLGGPSLKQNIRNLRHLPLGDFQPRTTWEYSNHMFQAVSHVIETVTGKPLGEVMGEKIWKPLGMDSTFLSIEDALAYEAKQADPEVQLAKLHVWEPDAKKFKQLPFWDDRGISGAGAIVSSVTDYAKWIKALIKQEDKAPLSAAGYAAITSPHMVSPPISPRFTGPISYGYGWWIAVYRGEKVIFHPGGVVGGVANMIFLPDRKFGVVGMCCAPANAVLDVSLWHLIDEFLDTPAEKRIDVFTQTKQTREMMKAHTAGEKDRLYPSVPTPKIPHSLPLDDYVGSYKHPVYGTITFREQKDSELIGSLPGRVNLDPFILEHITGEHFLAKVDLIRGIMTLNTRARFEIDASGKPAKLGVEFEDGKPDIVIWFALQEKKAETVEEKEKAAPVVPKPGVAAV